MQRSALRLIIFSLLALTSLCLRETRGPHPEVTISKVPIKQIKVAQVSRFVSDEDLQNLILKLKGSKRSLLIARDMRCWPSLYEMLEELKKKLDRQIELNRSLSPFRPSGQCYERQRL